MNSNINREHKDRLFKFIFGNEKNRSWTLSLYNAVNGSNYTDSDAIEFNTIEDVLYMSMKNDISFLITDTMNFYEHQSTFNPNMPVRMFIYAGMAYSRYIQVKSDFNMYSKHIQKLPLPKCVCFYNGRDEKEDRTELRLTDSFSNPEKSDIELKVLMININHGHNQKLMEACIPLKEYAWFVETVRNNIDKTGNIEKAVDEALKMMPDSFMIKKFLIENRAEVKSMCITEYDEAKAKEAERLEYEKAVEEERMKAALAKEEAAQAKEEASQAKEEYSDSINQMIKALTLFIKGNGISLEEAMDTFGLSMDYKEKIRKEILEKKD